jgi:hypothetical protein
MNYPPRPSLSTPRKFPLYFFSFTCKSPSIYSHAYSPLFSCVCRLFRTLANPIPNPLNPLAALHNKTPGGGVRPQKRESPVSFQSDASSAGSALASVAGDRKTPRPLRTLPSRHRLLLRPRDVRSQDSRRRRHQDRSQHQSEHSKDAHSSHYADEDHQPA